MTGDKARPMIGMSPPVNEIMNTLRAFLFKRVYNSEVVNREAEKAKKTVRLLYEYFMAHEGQLPNEYAVCGEPLARRVLDYVAGMTDQYAMRRAGDLDLL